VTEAVVKDLHFEKIKNAIITHKDKSSVEKTDDAITLSFSGIVYSVTSDKEESISFNAADLDFVAKPSGDILMMDVENGEISFYEIEEGDLKKSLREFLIWRANLLATVGI
jgi:hypothetical protein